MRLIKRLQLEQMEREKKNVNDALKSCPFCGGEAKYLMPTNDLHTVQCIHCAIGTPYSSRKEKSIAAWNRRAEPKEEVE